MKSTPEDWCKQILRPLRGKYTILQTKAVTKNASWCVSVGSWRSCVNFAMLFFNLPSTVENTQDRVCSPCAETWDFLRPSLCIYSLTPPNKYVPITDWWKAATSSQSRKGWPPFPIQFRGPNNRRNLELLHSHPHAHTTHRRADDLQRAQCTGQ